MFILRFSGSFVCFTHGAAADEFATPTPTPNFLKPLPAGPLRRAEWVDRRRVLQADAQSNAQARAQAKANRRSDSAAQKAESKEAAHARAQAQRELAAEARHESAKETPHTNSDLMARMGFQRRRSCGAKGARTVGPARKERNDEWNYRSESSATDRRALPTPQPLAPRLRPCRKRQQPAQQSESESTVILLS